MGEKSVATQITEAINGLDATVSSQTDNVSVTIVQTDGKLTSVTLSQTDIASASALTQEISDREDAIEAEASARTAADDAFTSAYTEAIANEASARTAADNAITSAYTAADQALQNAIDAAVAAAISVIAKDDSIVITPNAETATLKEFKVGDIDCGTF